MSDQPEDLKYEELEADDFTLTDLGLATEETKFGTFIFPTDGINVFRY